MAKYVFDIESDGLLDTVSQIWVLVTHDLDTNEVQRFSDHDDDLKPLMAGIDLLFNAEAIIGHNIIGYDLLVFRKILDWHPNPKTKVIDTMLLSQVLGYDRFNGKHSLAVWGKFLGHEKPEHEDWSKYSPEMLHRCVEDVGINVKVYRHLMRELSVMAPKKPYIKTSIRNEHGTAQFCADAEFIGWQFDKPKAIELLAAMDSEMLEVQKLVEPRLRVEVKRLDKEPKVPKWIKSGNYDAFTARYFGVTADTGTHDDRLVEGPYSRIEFVQPDLGNIDSVKLYLHTLGWEPDDWNWKKEGQNFIKVSEKLTTSSLEKLGEVGMLIDKYYTTRSRQSILKGWVESLDSNSRLHGSCFTIATPTGRARHSGIVNVPSGEAEWGADIRRLFIASPGYTIIGADSSGNQMRALLHYLKNDDYTNLVLNGDVHSANAKVLTEVVGYEVPRSVAKRLLYAFLFGCGAEKAALTVTGKRDKKIGRKILDRFTEATPGLGVLIKKLSNIYTTTDYEGSAWIPCVDGRKIPVDSPHKSLNYLLQSMEAVTCKAAVAMCYEELKAKGIPFNPLIWYHDEVEFEVPHEYAEQAAEIAKRSFKDAPKQFDVMLMDGEAKVGKDWFDVH